MSSASLNRPLDGQPDGDDDVRRSDAVLVQMAADGDREAIGTIWGRYNRLVRSVVIATLGPDQDTDDLIQEVFIGLFQAVDQVRDGTALPAILSRIAVRRVGMTLRRRHIRSLTMLLPWTHLPDVAVSAPDLDDRFAVRALYRLLDRMKERPRLALLLHYVQGMSVMEVSAALGISLATTKRAIGAGRKRLLELARKDAQLTRFLPPVEESDR